MTVIPAINAKTFEELKEKIKLVEPYVDSIHIDVADGSFTKNTLWHNPSDLMSLDTPLYIEVHLMMNDMDNKISDWLMPNACPERNRGVKRIIFHLSASRNPDFVISEIKKAGKEAGISISPDESAEEAMKYMEEACPEHKRGACPEHKRGACPEHKRGACPEHKRGACPEHKRGINFYQILGVYPGLAGQKTLESTFGRIKEVRDSCPSCIIEVDGGMNKETAKRAVESGANIIAAASAIFSAKGGPASGWNELKCL